MPRAGSESRESSKVAASAALFVVRETLGWGLFGKPISRHSSSFHNKCVSFLFFITLFIFWEERNSGKSVYKAIFIDLAKKIENEIATYNFNFSVCKLYIIYLGLIQITLYELRSVMCRVIIYTDLLRFPD